MSHPPRLLLIEGDPADAYLFQEMVNAHLPPDAVDVSHVTTGAGALAWLEDHDCDLIVLDLDHQRARSLEVLEALKSSRHLRHRPVVAWSTSDDPEDIRAVYDRHGNAYVQKRSRLADLGQTIRDLAHFWLETAALPV